MGAQEEKKSLSNLLQIWANTSMLNRERPAKYVGRKSPVNAIVFSALPVVGINTIIKSTLKPITIGTELSVRDSKRES